MTAAHLQIGVRDIHYVFMVPSVFSPGDCLLKAAPPQALPTLHTPRTAHRCSMSFVLHQLAWVVVMVGGGWSGQWYCKEKLHLRGFFPEIVLRDKIPTVAMPS